MSSGVCHILNVFGYILCVIDQPIGDFVFKNCPFRRVSRSLFVRKRFVPGANLLFSKIPTLDGTLFFVSQRPSIDYLFPDLTGKTKQVN